MAKNKDKDRSGIIYSTNQEFEYQYDSEESIETLEPGKQKLKVMLDKKSRNGKQVTLVADFVGTEDDLKELGKVLKTSCGVGGSVKDGEILIQGDFRNKILEILLQKGYGAKKSGG